MNPKKNYPKRQMQNVKKQILPPRSKKEAIGQPTGLLDVNGDEILTGARYALRSKNGEEKGVVLWNRAQNAYGLFSGLFYGENIMSADSYGKFTRIPADNGMRMQLIPFVGTL